MSRCFPFPPPGFVPNEIRDESLIKKGAVKREKKHRKHNKDKKRKDRENEFDGSKKHRHKRQRKDDGRELVVNNELGKSCLTLELEHQTSSQNSCDSTLHSSERPNHIQSQPLDETSIRILLHGKGQRYPESITNKDQNQGSSRDALRVCQENIRYPVVDPAIDISAKLSKEKKTIPLKDVESREINRQTSMQLDKEKPSSSHQEATGPSNLCRKCSPSTAVRFLNVIENWAPDRVKLTDSEDQEWWLLMKVGAKRHHQVSSQTTSSSMVWPSARFLPEAELHALPFT